MVMSSKFGVAAILLVLFAGLAALVMLGQTQSFDEAGVLALRQGMEPGGGTLMAITAQVTHLGDSITLAILALAAIGYMVARGEKLTAFHCFMTAAGAFLITAGAKAAFGRARPDIVEQFATATSASFPSGHTLRSAVVFSLIAYLLLQTPLKAHKTLILLVAGLLIVVNGVSRVYLGVHWPTDILGAWLIAAAWFLICTAFYERQTGAR